MKYHYNGDVNPEYGGYWFNLDDVEYGYTNAIRITPCSDAGCQDNAFWIDVLTVNLPDNEKSLLEVLTLIGYKLEDLPNDIFARNSMIVDASIAYGNYDVHSSIILQIGTEPNFSQDYVDPTVIVRKNVSIANYVKNNYLK